jgi:outer membrane protein insertion porin family
MRYNLLTFLAALLLILGQSICAQVDMSEREKLRWRRNHPPIEKITIRGNEYFDDGSIKGVMYSQTTSFFSWLKSDRRAAIQRETLGRDTVAIRRLYLEGGFLNIGVNEHFEALPEDSAAEVVVEISEGPRYYTGSKSLSGTYPDSLHNELTNEWNELEQDEPLNYFQLRQAAFDMKTVMANSGFPYAEVDYGLDTTDGDSIVPITFDIQSDSLVRFGRVSIAGLDEYPAYGARRELKIERGDIYRRQDIIDTRRRLSETGYFTTINIAQTDTTDRYRPKFEVRVRERETRYATIQTGIARDSLAEVAWDISAGYGKRNFLGTRRYDLYALGQFGLTEPRGLLEHKYQASFTEPWLFGLRMPLRLTAEWQPGVKDPEGSYRIETWSLSATSSRRFGLDYWVDGGLQYETVRIYGVAEDEIDDIKREEGLSVRRKLHINARRDSRDDLFIPTRGSLTKLALSYVGGFLGGDDEFTRSEVSWSSYQRVWPGWIAATRLEAAWASPFGSSDRVPIEDRYLLGGANTIRGFKVNSLGPRAEDGTLLRSEVYALFNQEFRWRTVQIHSVIPLIKGFIGSWPLWQTIFFDMGNGFADWDDMGWERLAYSYGMGVQLVSPAGPLRIDYARRIATEHIEAGSRWHFTILYAF